MGQKDEENPSIIRCRAVEILLCRVVEQRKVLRSPKERTLVRCWEPGNWWVDNPSVHREGKTAQNAELSVRFPRDIPAIKPFLIYSYLAGTWSPFSSPSHSMCWLFSGLGHCQCLFWTLGKNSYRLTMWGVIFCSPGRPASQCPKALILLLF